MFKSLNTTSEYKNMINGCPNDHCYIDYCSASMDYDKCNSDSKCVFCDGGRGDFIRS